MKTYTLNHEGKAAIDAIVAEHCKPDAAQIVDNWIYEDVEDAAIMNSWDGKGTAVEIADEYTNNGRPYTFECLPEWFDVTETMPNKTPHLRGY